MAGRRIGKAALDACLKYNKFKIRIKSDHPGVALALIGSGTAAASGLLDAVKNAYGGSERADQKFEDFHRGSICFALYCLTDERFLEVFDDHKSGRIKQRLEEEFLKIGIKTNELEVEIENMKEVEERKEAIMKNRYRKDQ